jgi:hypothetical protein
MGACAQWGATGESLITRFPEHRLSGLLDTKMVEDGGYA